MKVKLQGVIGKWVKCECCLFFAEHMFYTEAHKKFSKGNITL